MSCIENGPFDYQLSYREFHLAAARAQNTLTRDWNRNPEQFLRDKHHHYFLLGLLFHILSQGVIGSLLRAPVMDERYIRTRRFGAPSAV